MIFVRDKGQLCNNILQYANVYAWCRENHRECMSMRFAYKYQYFHICNTKYHNILYYLIGKFIAKHGFIPTISYDNIKEDKSEKEKFILAHKHVMVQGWCVRYYDLFIRYLDEIRHLFEFHQDIRNKISEYIKKTSHTKAVKIGIHIRRGDYKAWSNGKFYFNDEEYIRYAKRLIQSLDERDYIIFICGNENVDEKKYTTALGGEERVTFPHGNPGEDLCLLANCNYLIGPLSSFTLVASMYGKAKLHWMLEHNNIEDIKLEFKNFQELLPELDNLWWKYNVETTV